MREPLRQVRENCRIGDAKAALVIRGERYLFYPVRPQVVLIPVAWGRIS